MRGPAGTVLEWVGAIPHSGPLMYWEGANGSHIQDLTIIGAGLETIFHVDSRNDINQSFPGSSGVMLERSTITLLNGAQTAAAFRISHQPTTSATPQVSEIICRDCYFTGDANTGHAVHVNCPGNTKNFRFDACQFTYTRRGLTGVGSGVLGVTGCGFANIADCDIDLSTCFAKIDSCQSEGGHLMLFTRGGANSSAIDIRGCSWSGRCRPDGAVIDSSHSLIVECCEFENGPDVPWLIVSNVERSNNHTPAALTSRSNSFRHATYFPGKDPNGNEFVSDVGYYRDKKIWVDSRHDLGGQGGSLVKFGGFDGLRLDPDERFYG